MTLIDSESLSAPDFEPGEQRVVFEGDHALEGDFGWPDVPQVTGGVVVAHPYPPAGANMDLPVVYRIAKECRKRQLASLRFNFRSVGASVGEFSGTDEDRDVAAAVAFMRGRLEPAGCGQVVPPLGLAGWSFGSVMAARAVAELPEVQALALVGLVVHWEHLPADTLERLATFRGPVLAVCAENDHHGTPREVGEMLRPLHLDLKMEVIEAADHYLQGREKQVANLVADFFASTLARRQ